MLLFILDFDNTLGDTYGPYGEGNIFRTQTLPDKEKATEIYEKYRRGSDNIVVYPKLLEEYSITDPEKFFRDAGMGEQLFPDTVAFLTKIHANPDFRSVVLTTGDEDFQKVKVTVTGIDKLVDEVYVTRNRNKIEGIKQIIEKYQPEHTIFIDDHINMTEGDFDTPITIYEMNRSRTKEGPKIIHSLNVALITFDYHEENNRS